MSNVSKWVVIGAAALGVPLALLLVVINGIAVPWSIGVGVPLAAAYVLLVVWGLSRMPLWPRMPRTTTLWWVGSCLAWGGGFSLLLVSLFALGVMATVEATGWTDAIASFGGAYPEEPAKALGVLVILFLFPRLNRPWHGLATGALVGLGFETVENLLYGSALAVLDPVADWRGALSGWGLRLVAGPFLHIVWTAIAGWGIALALFAAGRSAAWRIGVALGWLSVAFVSHFLWNYMGPDYVAVATSVLAAVIMYSVIIWLVARCWKLARSDRSYVHTSGALRSFAQLPGRDSAVRGVGVRVPGQADSGRP